jgi:hypothetical protein
MPAPEASSYGQRHHRRHRRRQADSTGRHELIVGVDVGWGETRWHSREARKAGSRGVVGGAEAEKTKRLGGYRRPAAPGRCISNVGEGMEC